MIKSTRRALNNTILAARTHGVESIEFISACRKLHSELVKFTGFTGNINNEYDIDIHCDVASKMNNLLSPVFCGDYTIEAQTPGGFLLKGFDYDNATDYIVALV